MPIRKATSSIRRNGGKRPPRFLPSQDDRSYIESLMQPVQAAGAYADWIAPPKVGIDNKPGNFEYVKIAV